MIRVQLAIVVAAFVLFGSTAEARGRRAMYQQSYTPYYNTVAPTYTAAPTYTTPTVAPTSTVVQTNAVAAASNGVAPASNGVVQASGSAPAAAAASTPAATPKVTVVGSAQWKAEQSARIGSVQHLGGGFGGGSYEGNGFGATAEQAIQNSCFWGQRTPIEIGVARGANGYYATIFYR